jgi:hypothetical protein
MLKNKIVKVEEINEDYTILIRGRHKLNIKKYILEDEIKEDLLNFVNMNKLYEYINNCIDIYLNKYENTKQINLLLTGLSRVQHLVIKELIKRKIKVNVFDYSYVDRAYIHLTTY